MEGVNSSLSGSYIFHMLYYKKFRGLKVVYRYGGTFDNFLLCLLAFMVIYNHCQLVL